MILKGEVFSQRLQTFSNATMQQISHSISGLKNEQEAENLLKIISEAQTEQELVQKLKELPAKVIPAT